MKKQLKNYLLLSKINFGFINKQKFMLLFICLQTSIITAQIANYISNGSFEDKYSCSGPSYLLNSIKYWRGIDSINYGGAFLSQCYGTIPLNGNTYQFPRTGQTCIISTQFNPANSTGGRAYLRNRMKAKLISGKTYCVKYYVNISNSSPRGMNGFGIYFGDNTLDTITKCGVSLTYLNPQVINPLSNIISDTLNWIPITGTFVASGNEKFALIGNFLSDASVSTSPIYTSYYPQNWTDVLFDDVSCIPIDLPAYAGADIYSPPSTTVYIGRPQDVGIDEACTWYNLTNTTTAIANAAGITLTVTTTQSYMVKQNICGIIKYDTVIVYASGVGIHELEMLNDKLKIYPNPANEVINIEFLVFNNEAYKIEVINALGQIIKEEEITFKNNVASINTKELPNGVYYLKLKAENSLTISKRFVITR